VKVPHGVLFDSSLDLPRSQIQKDWEEKDKE